MSIILTDALGNEKPQAPLVITDSQELGDKRLNPEEALVKLKEENQKLSDKRKIPNQAEYEDAKRALGRPLHPNEVIRRISTANSKIVVKNGIENAVAIMHEVDGHLQYVTGFYTNDVMPEFSAVIVDERHVAVREVRGWRTVLLTLIEKGLLTLKQVEVLFGVAMGSRSELWEVQAREAAAKVKK